MNWPEVVELNDITITPLLDGNSKANLVLAAYPPSPALEHFRYGRHRSELCILPLCEAEAASAKLVEEPTIYGGLLFRHFGHSLSESMHRLWPRFAMKELRAANVAFSLVRNARVMPYVIEALNLHGITRGKVIRIDEPTRFRRLFVGQQARRLAGPTLIPEYRTMLDRELSKRMRPPNADRRIFISRLHHHHTGSFYGESYVEQVLAAEGFEIIYPERHTLTDLVSMLRSTSIAIFTEGSAIHALELCGSGTPHVCVIGRRPGAVERFRPLLSNICGKWTVLDHVLACAGMSDDPKKHSGVLNVGAVVDDLRAFAGLDSRGFSNRAVNNAIQKDLELHIGDMRNGPPRDFVVRQHAVRQAVLAATQGKLPS